MNIADDAALIPLSSWAPEKYRGVVFDIGMHDGTDTAFYVHQGYAVLAVEAEPEAAAAAAARFASDVERGQLQILNIGIGDKNATATFWLCDDNPVWNSFDVRIASRNGSRHHPIAIRMRRFADLLSAFGVPEYLKIDIEGADALCVRDLDSARLPRFISVESECPADGEVLDSGQAVCMLDLLRDAGYSRFKLVSQDDFRTTTYPDRWRLIRRVVDSAADGKLRRLGLHRTAAPISTRGRMERRNGGYRFMCGGSGPWGDGLLGEWVRYERARDVYLKCRQKYFASQVKTYAFWYDWHATY